MPGVIDSFGNDKINILKKKKTSVQTVKEC